VTGQRCKILESPEIEMGARIDLVLADMDDYAVNDIEYELFKNGESIDTGKLDKGELIKEELIPANYEILFVGENKDNKAMDKNKIKEKDDFEKYLLKAEKFGYEKISISIEKPTKVIIQAENRGLSEINV